MLQTMNGGQTRSADTYAILMFSISMTVSGLTIIADFCFKLLCCAYTYNWEIYTANLTRTIVCACSLQFVLENSVKFDVSLDIGFGCELMILALASQLEALASISASFVMASLTGPIQNTKNVKAPWLPWEPRRVFMKTYLKLSLTGT